MDEVQVAYQNQLQELHRVKEDFKQQVQYLQHETAEMREQNKKKQQECHIQQLRHEESLMTLQKIQGNFTEELAEQNNICS